MGDNNVRREAVHMADRLYILMEDGPDKDLLPMVNALCVIMSDRASKEKKDV